MKRLTHNVSVVLLIRFFIASMAIPWGICASVIFPLSSVLVLVKTRDALFTISSRLHCKKNRTKFDKSCDLGVRKRGFDAYLDVKLILSGLTKGGKRPAILWSPKKQIKINITKGTILRILSQRIWIAKVYLDLRNSHDRSCAHMTPFLCTHDTVPVHTRIWSLRPCTSRSWLFLFS